MRSDSREFGRSRTERGRDSTRPVDQSGAAGVGLFPLCSPRGRGWGRCWVLALPGQGWCGHPPGPLLWGGSGASARMAHVSACYCTRVPAGVCPVHVRTREPLGQGRVCQEQHVHAHASQAGEGRSSPCFKQAENKPLDLWLIFIGWVCVIAMLIVLERKRAVECKPWVRL